MLKPSISLEEFAMRAKRTGIPLTEAQIAKLYEAQGWSEAMTASLRQGVRDRSAEPALIFKPEIRS